MRGELNVLNASGHTSVAWDTEVAGGPLDPEFAALEFDRLVAQGHLAFGTTKTGENEQIRTFDPERYPKVTVTPPLVGG